MASRIAALLCIPADESVVYNDGQEVVRLIKVYKLVLLLLRQVAQMFSICLNIFPMNSLPHIVLLIYPRYLAT